MTTTKSKDNGFRVPLFQGLLPIKGSQVPMEIIAGITLAALAIPEVMGYTKIAGTPVITAGVSPVPKLKLSPSIAKTNNWLGNRPWMRASSTASLTPNKWLVGCNRSRGSGVVRASNRWMAPAGAPERAASTSQTR